MSAAAIVLCGGRSRRMGRDKASLPFGDETLLDRVVRVLAPLVDAVWLVAREGQDLDAVPAGARVVRDPAEGLGPLAGIAAALDAIQESRAFVTACDAPFLAPSLVEWLLDAAEGHDACVPFVGGYYMTTCAVYGRGVRRQAAALVAERRLRPLFLVQSVDARIVEEKELRGVDPELKSFWNCNTEEEYEAALREAGLL